jgi:hypothetical protein
MLRDFPFAGEVAVDNAAFNEGALASFWPTR